MIGVLHCDVSKYCKVMVPQYLWYCSSVVLLSLRRFWNREKHIAVCHASTVVLPNPATAVDLSDSQLLPHTVRTFRACVPEVKLTSLSAADSALYAPKLQLVFYAEVEHRCCQTRQSEPAVPR